MVNCKEEGERGMYCGSGYGIRSIVVDNISEEWVIVMKPVGDVFKTKRFQMVCEGRESKSVVKFLGGTW